MMTKLCTYCEKFDIQRLRQRGLDRLAPNEDVETLSSFSRSFQLIIFEYQRGRQTFLRGVRLKLVEAGQRKGCQFCHLMLNAVGSTRIEGARRRFGNDDLWIHLRPRLSRRHNSSESLGLTHIEIFVGDRFSTEPTYHGIIHFFADEGSAARANNDVVGTLFGDKSSSIRHFDWVQSQLESCEKEHSLCRTSISGESFPDGSVPDLPTRLIYVRAESLHLVSLKRGTQAKYIALSYRWPRVEDEFTTTANTIDQHTNKEEGFPIDAVPETIRDAILICRTLDIEYLWVDALCIIQPYKKRPHSHVCSINCSSKHVHVPSDAEIHEMRAISVKDMQNELPKMGMYYQNAFCVLAACAATQDDGGCFKRRDWEAQGIRLPYRNSHGMLDGSMLACVLPSFHDDVTASEWARRGWVLQERLMARRTIYYAAGRVYFECQKHGTQAENGEKIDRVGRRDPSSIEARTRLSLPSVTTDMRYWYRMMEVFSTCVLTNSSDRIPAIIGMSMELKKLYKQGNSEYDERNIDEAQSWGIWLRDLRKGLLWRAASGHKPLLHQCSSPGLSAPSWSWAKLTSPIVYPRVPIFDRIKMGGRCQMRFRYDETLALNENVPGGIGQKLRGLCILAHRATCLLETSCNLPNWARRRLEALDGNIPVGDNFDRFCTLKCPLNKEIIGYAALDDDSFPSQAECLLVAKSGTCLVEKGSDHLPVIENESDHLLQIVKSGGLLSPRLWSFDTSEESQQTSYILLLQQADSFMGQPSDSLQDFVFNRIGIGEIVYNKWWGDALEQIPSRPIVLV